MENELSKEQLALIDLVRAGEVELVEQLFEGNPKLFTGKDDELTRKLHNCYLFPTNVSDRIDWYCQTSEKEWTIKNWLMYWVEFKRKFPSYG